MITNEQIAHDLAMAYVINRHGAEVTGQFTVETSYSDRREVTGDGSVGTERLPDVDATKKVRIGTGERYLFGLLERTKKIDTGDCLVDPVFRAMVHDYQLAYERFLTLLIEDAAVR